MYVVAIGPFENRELEMLNAAAGQCDLSIRAFDKPAEAAALVLGNHEAPSGFFAARLRTIAALSEWVRQSPTLLNVPIVALIDRPSEGQFRDAFAAGADDALVGADVGSLRTRLETLSANRTVGRPLADNGLALVTMSDGALRRWVGRTLRQMGFNILFASETSDVLAADAGMPTLIVTNREAMERAAGTGPFGDASIPKLVLDDDAWQNAGDTKAKLLFFTDETVARGPIVDSRRSERVLFETICAFRAAGSMQSAYGLTHNISREGLYVRTLSSPAVGTELWLELRTLTGAPVHLRGRVMWCRQAGQGSATKPAGFGFRIDAVQTPTHDLSDWESAYESLLSATRTIH